MFVRFVIYEKHAASLLPTGVFQAAAELRDGGTLSNDDAIMLKAHLRWFDEFLEKPTRFTSSKSKGAYRRKHKGVSWFKDTAKDHIARIREIACLLQANDLPVTMITAERPGYILYEDDFQIVAEPFSSTEVGPL